jgi:endonuclease III related protein
MLDSHELFSLLKECDLMQEKPHFWWPAYGSFEVVVGAILTQNANWNRVEISLENLRSYGVLDLHAMATCKMELLLECIRPSGLFQNKSATLKRLSTAIIEAFGDFEHFTCKVDRAWLLAQKGVGKETADSILCYACKRNVMVVDAYTQRLLSALGYEFEDYDDLQAWFESENTEMAAQFHGMIVEYVKAHSKAKKVNIDFLLQHS